MEKEVLSAELRANHLSNGIFPKQRGKNIRRLMSGNVFHRPTCHLLTRMETPVSVAVTPAMKTGALQKAALFCCSQEFRKVDN
jgi:hypothetical protein